MMMLGFASIGFTAYRRKQNGTAFRIADLLPNRGGLFVYRRAAISAIREYRYTVLETFAWASRLISTSTHGPTCQG
jgi:hypothetical protein